jgi:D-amino-acid dehydrogenase
MKSVAIVGGGVAGLFAAYFLRLAGAEVTVFEGNGVGTGASFGNAGWLCPAQAGPLAEPGLAADGLRRLASPESPLYFAPRHVPRMTGWLLRFARRCNSRDYSRGVEALGRLGHRTFALFEALERDGVDFELHRHGLLLAAEDPRRLEVFLHGLAPMRALGYSIPDRPLDGAAARELEPQLSSHVRAGALLTEHWHVEPSTLTAGLTVRLRALGVEIDEGVEVPELAPRDRGGQRLRTSAGDRAADTVVIAAGAWSAGLTRSLGFRLPLQAGKGYSFELAVPQPLRQALELLDTHLGLSSFTERLRVVGTMEFSGINLHLDERRMQAIVRGAARALPGLPVERIEHRWVGMRPIVPDGLPVIDRVPGHEHVYVATAYSMLGMTLAAPAGEALARYVTSGSRPPELEPFRADRFA